MLKLNIEEIETAQDGFDDLNTSYVKVKPNI